MEILKISNFNKTCAVKYKTCAEQSGESSKVLNNLFNGATAELYQKDYT